MADNYAISCLVGFMDHLWFHQVILFSDPSSTSNLLCSKILKPPSISVSMAVSEELSYSSSINDSQIPLISEEDSSAINYQDEFYKQESDDQRETTCTTPEERSTRLNLFPSKARSHSSSPSNLKSSRNLRFSSTGRILHKTMSCKSLCDLELEEVKGFMDLGFTFNKEHMSKRMMSVIPGLQRLELSKSISPNEISRDDETERDEEEGEKKPPISRPYLSEAWLIKRPDSPLLNLRIPCVSTTADMKKHLKYWARTVASAIELES